MLSKFLIEINPYYVGNPLREREVVLGLHAHADVAYFPVDCFLCSFAKVIGVDDCTIPSAWTEVLIPVSSDELAKALSSVEQVNLCPKVNQSVRSRSACEPDHAKELRLNYSEAFESNSLMVLER